MPDIYGTEGPIIVGSQVVVTAPTGLGTATEDLMGTVTNVGCPTFGDLAGPAFHVLIEGDSEAICYPEDFVRLYADIYAEADHGLPCLHRDSAYGICLDCGMKVGRIS